MGAGIHTVPVLQLTSADCHLFLDYKLSLRGKTGEERERALQGCHERGAKRLMELCFSNGGIYTKVSIKPRGGEASTCTPLLTARTN